MGPNESVSERIGVAIICVAYCHNRRNLESCHMKRAILVLLLFGTGAGGIAQTKRDKGTAPVDLNSPTWKAYEATHDALWKKGMTALHAEYTRENEGNNCGSLQSEAEIGSCNGRDNEITQANYDAYARTLSALLRLQPPIDDPLESFPKNRGKTFDSGERAWVLYRKMTCSAKSDAWYGGSGQGQLETSCLQDLTRRHMHELESIYSKDYV